jgi:hypothetical protein
LRDTNFRAQADASLQDPRQFTLHLEIEEPEFYAGSPDDDPNGPEIDQLFKQQELDVMRTVGEVVMSIIAQDGEDLVRRLATGELEALTNVSGVTMYFELYFNQQLANLLPASTVKLIVYHANFPQSCTEVTFPPHLQRLSLISCSIQAPADFRLAASDSLTHLDVSGTHVQDFRFAATATNLRSLRAHCAGLKTIEGVAAFINLAVLDVSYTNVQDMAHLTNTNLRKLNLAGTKVTEFLWLEGFVSLRELTVSSGKAEAAAGFLTNAATLILFSSTDAHDVANTPMFACLCYVRKSTFSFYN